MTWLATDVSLPGPRETLGAFFSATSPSAAYRPALLTHTSCWMNIFAQPPPGINVSSYFCNVAFWTYQDLRAVVIDPDRSDIARSLAIVLTSAADVAATPMLIYMLCHFADRSSVWFPLSAFMVAVASIHYALFGGALLLLGVKLLRRVLARRRRSQYAQLPSIQADQ